MQLTKLHVLSLTYLLGAITRCRSCLSNAVNKCDASYGLIVNLNTKRKIHDFVNELHAVVRVNHEHAQNHLNLTKKWMDSLTQYSFEPRLAFKIVCHVDSNCLNQLNETMRLIHMNLTGNTLSVENITVLHKLFDEAFKYASESEEWIASILSESQGGSNG